MVPNVHKNVLRPLLFSYLGTQPDLSLVTPVRTERRKHRRLEIGLSLAFEAVDREPSTIGTATTINVSTGGVYFGMAQAGLEPGCMLDVELTIPPGQGHFPYEGRITNRAEVVRVDPIDAGPNPWGIAAQFCQPPKLAF